MPSSARDGASYDAGVSGRRLVVATAIAGALLAGGVGCATGSSVAASDTAQDTEELLVSIVGEVSEDVPLSAAQIEASGPGEPEIELVSANGGQVRTERGYDGGLVLAFPAHQASRRPPIAILALSSRDWDWLQPRDDQLTFGADLTVDAVSDGTARDNGDNVIQRGLFGAAAQFKLQVDHRRPSCLVRGDAGMVLAKSSVTLEPGSWYRVTCRRAGEEVEVMVSRLGHEGPVDTEVDRDRGEIGSVTFPSDTFLSIGGKLGPHGGPVLDAVDQYDGSLSQVHVSVEQPD